MLEFGDNIVQEPHIENFFDKEFSFNTTRGFQLAFTVSAYTESEQGDPLDDSYGKVVAKYKTWGEINEVTGELVETYFSDIEVAPCKRENFIINPEDEENNNEAKFYPTA